MFTSKFDQLSFLKTCYLSHLSTQTPWLSKFQNISTVWHFKYDQTCAALCFTAKPPKKYKLEFQLRVKLDWQKFWFDILPKSKKGFLHHNRKSKKLNIHINMLTVKDSVLGWVFFWTYSVYSDKEIHWKNCCIWCSVLKNI